MKVALDVLNRRRKQALHIQLAAAIRSAIKEGHYKPGERIESERDFMRQGGLSYPTVARALGQVANEGWITRKHRRGTFVADPIPEQETGQMTVGVVYYKRNEFFLPIFSGIESECRRRKCSAFPLFEGDQGGSEDRILRELDERGVSGILAVPSLSESQHRELIRMINRHVPVVLMDTYLPEVTCDAVVIDNMGAMEDVTHYLLGLGHRRITFVTQQVQYPYGTSVRDRNAGVRQVLREAGLTDDQDWVVEYGPAGLADSTLDEAVDQVVGDLLNRPAARRPTAIMCVHDTVALSVIQSLRRRGLRVPQDVSVTGFDDLPWGSHVDPPLTTVIQPLERIGTKAAQLLFRRLRFLDQHPVRLELDARLVIRDSTGPPPSDGQPKA